jgi:hypothetical protein
MESGFPTVTKMKNLQMNNLTAFITGHALPTFLNVTPVLYPINSASRIYCATCISTAHVHFIDAAGYNFSSFQILAFSWSTCSPAFISTSGRNAYKVYRHQVKPLSGGFAFRLLK